jgi:hypothetical protein
VYARGADAAGILINKPSKTFFMDQLEDSEHMKLPVKNGWYCVLLAIAFSSLVAACQLPLQPFVSGCKANDEISTKDRETVDQVAIKFVHDALGPNPSAAYATFTADAKGNVPLDRFVSLFQNGIKPIGPFKDMRVAESYVAQVTGGSQEQRVVCGNLSSPEGWVAVNAKPGPAEAHVIVEGDTVNNTMAFVVWLIPEQGNWRIQYFHFTAVQMVSKSASDLQRIAEVEKRKQHNFNAFIFYVTALQLADRGPFFQLGIRPEIEKEIGETKRPENLQGQPPFTWNLAKSTFKVLNVGAIGVGGKIYLLIDHEVGPWAEDKEADRKNRDLIAAFAEAYPEFRAAFAGLIVKAHERGSNRTFGTLDENQK